MRRKRGPKIKSPVLIVAKYLKEEQLTELDLELYDWLEEKHDAKGRLEDSDKDYWPQRLDEDGGWEGDAEPIPIEKLEKLCADMRKLGATHIEMMQHNDHNGYHAFGVHISIGTADQAKQFAELKAKKVKKDKDKRIKQLRDELRNLEG
jgi:hypothetical protein